MKIRPLICHVILCLYILPAHPQSNRPSSTETIPTGAIRIPVPEIQQPENYSCGAAALMSILAYYGLPPEDYGVLKRELGTNKKNGTDYRRMVSYAAAQRLHAEALAPMTLEALDACLDGGRPVICSIQAYAEKGSPEQRAAVYEQRNDNGHYVVAIGRDARNYYFMDPSLTGRRGYLTREEFLKRWHDNEGTDARPKIIHRLGLVIWKDNPSSAYESSARRIE